MLTFRDAPWYALHVRSNHEQIVHTQLEQKGLASFLPIYRSVRTWSDRTKEIDRPLFPGYVFSSFAAKDHLTVIKSTGVVRVVGFARQAAPVDHTELEQVQLLVNSGLLAAPCPFLIVGETVYLQDGPLKGTEGKVAKIEGSLRLVVTVSLLQRSVSVAIDRSWVKPVRKTLLPACHDLASFIASHTAA